MCIFFMFALATAIDDRCYHDNVTGGTLTIYVLKVVGVVCFLEFQGFKTEGLVSLVFFKKNCLVSPVREEY